MIVSSAPLRISFCGGGTDYRSYYETFGGAVIGAAINQRVFVFINPLSKFSQENIRFTYRITESVNQVDSITHPVVRAALEEMGISSKINIATMADVPGNSGLGSSSAFTVALIGGLARFKGINLEMNEIVTLAYKIEREILNESGGVQDFLHAAHGSLRFYQMHESGEVSNTDLLSAGLQDLLEKRVALIRIGESRESSVHAKITSEAVSDVRSLQALHKNMEITNQTKASMVHSSEPEDQYAAITKAVYENWESKKIFQGGGSSVEISRIESTLRPHGLKAMKLCGAGTSGYLLTLFEGDVPLEQIESHDLLEFKIQALGLQIQEI